MKNGRIFPAGLLGLFLVLVLVWPAVAMKPAKDEQKRLDQCEEDVCNLILSKDVKSPVPRCNIVKTWSKDTIKEGESSFVSWAFGDTRCEANLKVANKLIVAALTRPKYTLQSPMQTVNCVIDDGDKAQRVVAKANPKIKFKNGVAKKIYIKLKSIDGPGHVTGPISTIAQLEDKLGIFHSSLLKSVNKFVHRKCEKKYGAAAKKAKAKAEAKKSAGGKKADGKTEAKAKPVKAGSGS